jgi:hypothetical protein
MITTSSYHDFFNLSRLGLDQGVGFRETVEFRHGGSGAGTAAVVPVVTGCLGEEEDSEPEDDGPDEADAHGDAVGCCGGEVFGAVVDAVCGEDTDRDEELVAPGNNVLAGGLVGRWHRNLRDNGSSNWDWRRFRHVERD